MRVLVADEDSSTRHLLWRLLTDWGHDVVVASDTDEAWTVLRQEAPPALAIIDRGLPKGGGLGLCRLLRQGHRDASTYVIVAGATVDSPAMVAAYEAGADELIAKPFDFADLHRHVEEGVRVAVARRSSAQKDAAVTADARAPMEAPRFVATKEPRGEEAVFAIGSARASEATALPSMAAAVLPTPDERPLLALARLGQRAVEGVRLGDFARMVARELVDSLGCQAARVYTQSPGCEAVLRAEVEAAPRRPLAIGPNIVATPARPGAADLTVSFGPEERPEGCLIVQAYEGRTLAAPQRELITGAGHLLGLVAQRERLEQRIRQAQKMEIFGHMAGGVAHDFNNVLSVVGTSTATLAAMVEGDHELTGELSLVERAVERGRLLASRLLAFGRAPSERPGVIELNEAVFSARGMLERMLQGRVAITTDLEPRPLLIHASREDIEQVLVNLVLNARDACGGGGDVVVRTGHAPGMVTFSVTDRGTGMSEQTRGRMFEPFFTTKAPADGTGVGLATVQEIVQRGDGRLDVETALGSGTTVTVQWPCAAANCCRMAVSGAA